MREYKDAMRDISELESTFKSSFKNSVDDDDQNRIKIYN
jgi:hypothetical protein